MHFLDVVDSPHFDTFIKIRVSAAVHLWVLPWYLFARKQNTYGSFSGKMIEIRSQKRRNEILISLSSLLYVNTVSGNPESRKQTKPKSSWQHQKFAKNEIGFRFLYSIISSSLVSVLLHGLGNFEPPGLTTNFLVYLRHFGESCEEGPPTQNFWKKYNCF